MSAASMVIPPQHPANSALPHDVVRVEIRPKRGYCSAPPAPRRWKRRHPGISEYGDEGFSEAELDSDAELSQGDSQPSGELVIVSLERSVVLANVLLP